jgi:hypothetical protein
MSNSKKFVFDTALGNIFGAPSGKITSFAGAGKFVAYDMPKFFLQDIVWQGLAEGMGLREPEPLMAPWERPEESKSDESSVLLPVYIFFPK